MQTGPGMPALALAQGPHRVFRPVDHDQTLQLWADGAPMVNLILAWVQVLLLTL